jgi:hypothetical protein
MMFFHFLELVDIKIGMVLGSEISKNKNKLKDYSRFRTVIISKILNP